MDNRIFFLLTKTENSMSVYIRQQFQKSGLVVTPSQLAILFLLKAKNSQSMSELSQALGTDNSAVTRIIDRLEKSGLVVRNSNSSDRREYQIMMTIQGYSETERVKEVIKEINRKISDEFSDTELEVFLKTLIKMDNLFRS